MGFYYRSINYPVALDVFNVSGDLFLAGSPVRITSVADQAALSIANSISNATVIGICLGNIPNGSSGATIVTGPVKLTEAQWNAVTGGSGGLVPGSKYFVHPTIPGGLTDIAPSIDGQVIAPVGVAKSTSELTALIGPRVIVKANSTFLQLFGPSSEDLRLANPSVLSPNNTVSVSGTTLTSLKPGVNNALDSPDGATINAVNLSFLPNGSFGCLTIVCPDSGLIISGEDGGSLVSTNQTLGASTVTYFQFYVNESRCALAQIGPSVVF